MLSSSHLERFFGGQIVFNTIGSAVFPLGDLRQFDAAVFFRHWINSFQRIRSQPLHVRVADFPFPCSWNRSDPAFAQWNPDELHAVETRAPEALRTQASLRR